MASRSGGGARPWWYSWQVHVQAGTEPSNSGRVAGVREQQWQQWLPRGCEQWKSSGSGAVPVAQVAAAARGGVEQSGSEDHGSKRAAASGHPGGRMVAGSKRQVAESISRSEHQQERVKKEKREVALGPAKRRRSPCMGKKEGRKERQRDGYRAGREREGDFCLHAVLRETVSPPKLRTQ